MKYSLLYKSRFTILDEQLSKLQGLAARMKREGQSDDYSDVIVDVEAAIEKLEDAVYTMSRSMEDVK